MYHGFGSEKTNLLLNLISLQLGIDKKYLYAKDLYEVKYQLLISKCGSAPLKHFEDPSTSTEYSMIWMIFTEKKDKYNPNKPLQNIDRI